MGYSSTFALSYGFDCVSEPSVRQIGWLTNVILVKPRFAAVKAKATASPQSGEAPLRVQLTSEMEGEIASVRWVFDDGQFSTNVSPAHIFTQPSNYSVLLVAYPIDPLQNPVESRLVVKVRKPVAAWLKWLPFVGCIGLVTGVALFLARSRQKRALRLSVYFWPDNLTACRSLALTGADEARELTPYAPVRIKRVGKSTALVVEPLNGSALLSPNGEEIATQNIGQGARIMVRSASTPTRAIAISVAQQPRRPAAVTTESDPFSETVESEIPTRTDNCAWDWEATEISKI